MSQILKKSEEGREALGLVGPNASESAKGESPREGPSPFRAIQGDQKHNLYTQVKSSEKKTEHLVVAIVEDKPGVFSRIAGLFRRRNFNIKSLTIGNCEQKGLSRMTLVVDGTKTVTQQLIKQLYKIIEVIKVMDMNRDQNVVRELALVKITATKNTRTEIIQIVELYKAKVVDVSLDAVMVEIVGEPKRINDFLELVKGFGIRELARTGVTTMQRGGASSVA